MLAIDQILYQIRKGRGSFDLVVGVGAILGGS